MRAGDLRHRVVIQNYSVAQDDYGAPVKTWSNEFTVWGAVEPLSGREYLDAREMQAEVTTRIRVRYRGDVTYSTDKRATWDGHTYDIESVIEVEGRRREIHLMCKEVV